MKPLPPLLSVLALAAASLALPVQASAKAPAQPHDFNGDGRTDLVVNASQSVKSGEVGPGAVAVLYGKTNRKQVVSRYSAGVSSVADHGDGFGESTASADFDRDGYADLAITGPDEDGVTLVYGSKKGLSGRAAFLGADNAPDPWPINLAVGDFDRDGRADLVATVRNRYSVFSKVDKGRKPTVRTGEVTGAGTYRTDRLIPVVGDFNGDRRDDVVLGSADEGFTRLLWNSASGLTAPAAVPGLDRVAALAVGDFNGDGRDDLASAFWDRIKIHLGRPSGFAKPRSIKPRDAHGTSITGYGGDQSLATGDVDRDGKDELAVGAPYAGARYSGQVAVLPGHRSGLSTEGIQVFSQKSRGLKGTPERGDHFGWAVRLLDLSGDRRPELVIGSPGEDKGTGRFYLLANEKKITPLGTRRYRSKDFGLGGRRFGLAFLP